MNCGKDMPLVKGTYSLYRRCPNYERRNRKEHESACMNRISCKKLRDIRVKITELESDLQEGMYIYDTSDLKVEISKIYDTYVEVSLYKKYRSRYKARKK